MTMSFPLRSSPFTKWLRQQSRGLPDFLAPSLAARAPRKSSLRSFSVSPQSQYPRDRNRDRGVSAIRRTGTKKLKRLSVANDPLPQPLPAKDISKLKVDDDHGLWGFFNKSRSALTTPEEDYAHGRAWTVEELRRKDWTDLHKLWWVCCKERNRIATMDAYRKQINAGYGDYESEDRLDAVKKTQNAIREVLLQRWYAWSDARKLAEKDPRFDLSGEGPILRPDYEEDLPDTWEAREANENIQRPEEVVNRPEEPGFIPVTAPKQPTKSRNITTL